VLFQRAFQRRRAASAHQKQDSVRVRVCVFIRVSLVCHCSTILEYFIFEMAWPIKLK